VLTSNTSAYDLVDAALRALEEHPELAVRLREVLGGVLGPGRQGDRLMTVREYAEHAGYCPRSIENFIHEGMPLVGEGRRRRVSVREADAWLRGRRRGEAARSPSRGLVGVEERARQDARRAAAAEQRRGPAHRHVRSATAGPRRGTTA
jgi:hypothetical protein